MTWRSTRGSATAARMVKPSRSASGNQRCGSTASPSAEPRSETGQGEWIDRRSMKKVALYSSSPWSRKPERVPRHRGFAQSGDTEPAADGGEAQAASPLRKRWFRKFGERHELALFLVAGHLISFTSAGSYLVTRQTP